VSREDFKKMATDFTPNYNLDKYTATDKPNLRDQYNAAMNKIDSALLSANTNATEAKAIAQDFADDIAGKADQTDLDALADILPDTDFSSQNTVKDMLDAKASQTDLNNTKQEIQTDLIKRTFVSVLDYGAKGDGITDDTTAFQNALNTGYDIYIPVDKKQKYLITNTLNITTTAQQIYSSYDSRITESDASVGIIFNAATSNHVCFNVAAHAVRFVGICIHGKTSQNKQGIGISAVGQNNAQYVDMYVSNCEFWNLYICVQSKGRGLRCENDSFVNAEIGILKQQQSNTAVSQARAFQVYNNRFHVLTKAIEIDAIETLMVVTGNLFDIPSNTSSYFIYGPNAEIFDSVISSNTCTGIIVLKSLTRSTISDCTFRIVGEPSHNYIGFINLIDSDTLLSIIKGCTFFGENTRKLTNCVYVETSKSLIGLIVSNCSHRNGTANPNQEYACLCVNASTANVNRFGVIGYVAVVESSTAKVVRLVNANTTDNTCFVIGNASYCQAGI
jgi:hypothetical protein